MKLSFFPASAALALYLFSSALAGAQNLARGKAIVTLLPKQGAAAPAPLEPAAIDLRIDNRKATVSTWKPLRGKIEIVLLIDSSLQSSLAEQASDLTQFVKSLPPNVSAAFAYMQNGRSLFLRPFSSDPAVILKGLHLAGGLPGASASPYFCLSDLARHWPSADPEARRVILAITDGVDAYHPEIDSSDPYILSAIRDATQAHISIYSIYWQNWHRPSLDAATSVSYIGQNQMAQVVEATGGKSFYQGTSNPVSFLPYLEELKRRLANQYELAFEISLKNKPALEGLHLKLRLPGVEVLAPNQVWMSPAAQ